MVLSDPLESARIDLGLGDILETVNRLHRCTSMSWCGRRRMGSLKNWKFERPQPNLTVQETTRVISVSHVDDGFIKSYNS